MRETSLPLVLHILAKQNHYQICNPTIVASQQPPWSYIADVIESLEQTFQLVLNNQIKDVIWQACPLKNNI